ncbi:S8 family serine peptidase [Nannocystis bainbridge]|uniref:S8 family serine peptidase n=1 Tax=Nannocystis bainbridge TaxID=2995303 RepID=A0ABT5E869_9BACT|nr:S8 family serine peptidase [Nannocystis bainbridge]MDC0721633.1 S8 family serine peptidase [Nannocystis bainbridge]
MRKSPKNSDPGHSTRGCRVAGATAFACALLGACDSDLPPDLEATAEVADDLEVPAAVATEHDPALHPDLTPESDPAPADLSLADDSSDMSPRTGFDPCPEGRQIALDPPGGCTHRSGPLGYWKATSLFAEVTPPLTDAGAPPPALAGYCQFTWTPNSPAIPPQLTYLPASAESGLAPDCEVVWGQGDVLTDALADDLRDAHQRHLGAAPQFVNPGAPVPVTIAVLDSAPNAFVDARSDHGESVGETIRRVACAGPGQCTNLVRYELALPRFGEHNVDWTLGGHYGSQRELAQAIFGSVRRWKSAGASQRLVLNVSLAWEPNLFGGTGSPATMPAPARAVFHALQYAACEGALIVTAAGNATGDTCQTGPMAPAIWESRAAPTPALCQAFGVANSTSSAAFPLVRAVSGIGHDNRPLQATRPGGRPRLAAPAFMAVGGPNAQPTTPLTGTSLAAASVSGVAALAWSYEPGLTAGQLGQRLYAAAAPILPHVPAQFGTTDPIRRITACSTLAACTGARCPTVVCSAPLPDLAALADASYLAVDALRDADSLDMVDALAVTTASACTDVCGDSLHTFTPASGAQTACDHDEVAGRQRYTSPQPEWPACPACFLSNSNATAYLALGERFADRTVSDVELELEDANATQRFVLGALPLTVDRVTEVTLPPDELLATPRRATLHITFASGATQSNEIPIH